MSPRTALYPIDRMSRFVVDLGHTTYPLRMVNLVQVRLCFALNVVSNYCRPIMSIHVFAQQSAHLGFDLASSSHMEARKKVLGGTT